MVINGPKHQDDQSCAIVCSFGDRFGIPYTWNIANVTFVRVKYPMFNKNNKMRVITGKHHPLSSSFVAWFPTKELRNCTSVFILGYRTSNYFGRHWDNSQLGMRGSDGMSIFHCSRCLVTFGRAALSVCRSGFVLWRRFLLWRHLR